MPSSLAPAGPSSAASISPASNKPSAAPSSWTQKTCSTPPVSAPWDSNTSELAAPKPGPSSLRHSPASQARLPVLHHPLPPPLVIIARRGGSSSTGRAPDCGSGRCGFDSRLPPQKYLQPFVALASCLALASASCPRGVPTLQVKSSF